MPNQGRDFTRLWQRFAALANVRSPVNKDIQGWHDICQVFGVKAVAAVTNRRSTYKRQMENIK